MSEQIIKQPDGRYAVWYTTEDAFAMIDATADDIIAARVAEAADRIAADVRRVIAKLERGDYQDDSSVPTWDELLVRYRDTHGVEFNLEAERDRRILRFRAQTLLLCPARQSEFSFPPAATLETVKQAQERHGCAVPFQFKKGSL